MSWADDLPWTYSDISPSIRPLEYQSTFFLVYLHSLLFNIFHHNLSNERHFYVVLLKGEVSSLLVEIKITDFDVIAMNQFMDKLICGHGQSSFAFYQFAFDTLLLASQNRFL